MNLWQLLYDVFLLCTSKTKKQVKQNLQQKNFDLEKCENTVNCLWHVLRTPINRSYCSNCNHISQEQCARSGLKKTKPCKKPNPSITVVVLKVRICVISNDIVVAMC